jgi:hypothetical protein
MLERSSLVEKNVFNTVMSGFLINFAVGLFVMGAGGLGTVAGAGAEAGAAAARGGAVWRVAAKVCVVGASFFGLQVPFGLKKIRSLDQYYEKYGKRRR